MANTGSLLTVDNGLEIGVFRGQFHRVAPLLAFAACAVLTYVTISGHQGGANAPLKSAAPITVQYVSPGGSDSNDGLTWETAKLTIFKAAASLPGGDKTTTAG